MFKLFKVYISKWKLLLAMGDICALVISGALGLILSPKIPNPWLFLVNHKLQFILVGAAYLLVLYIADLYDHYRDFRLRENIIFVICSSLLGTLVVITIFYFPMGTFVGRIFLVWQGAAFLALLVLWRYAFSAAALTTRLKSRVLIVGAGKAGQRMVEAIRRRPRSGFQVEGFVDDDPGKAGQKINDLGVLGNSADLLDLVANKKIGLVIIAVTRDKSPALLDGLIRLTLSRCRVIDMPTAYEFLTGKTPIDHISDDWLLFTSLSNGKIYYRRIKRLLDLGMALLMLFLSSPLFLLAAAAVKLESRGPVFYRQKRLGEDSKPFHIIKFRTMIPEAEPDGPRLALSNDRRVTRLGRILRKMHLDELPQLLNIIKGEMSLIGPRPEREEFVEQFREPVPVLRSQCLDCPVARQEEIILYQEKIPYYRLRLLVKPGLTGWAQVVYPYASTLEESKEKLRYDLYYIKHMGFFLDLVIMLKTIRTVFLGTGR